MNRTLLRILSIVVVLGMVLSTMAEDNGTANYNMSTPEPEPEGTANMTTAVSDKPDASDATALLLTPVLAAVPVVLRMLS
ncbi:hypothetical protein LSAT2_003240 [Lamellibrachia satsuma]|nr:hypothetical protein LSAT2_003240 [Lamellibrachia satsuma]